VTIIRLLGTSTVGLPASIITATSWICTAASTVGSLPLPGSARDLFTDRPADAATG